MDEPIVKEGWPFLAAAAAAAALAWILVGVSAGLPLALLAALVANFFRNPRREVPDGPGLVVSPADGVVVEVAGEPAPRLYGAAATRISIFMNALDVHVNRSPIGGRVVEVAYNPGKFLAANAPKASVENEQSALLLESPSGRRVMLVQIAGLIARRIVTYARPGDRLERGQRFGMIRFGSRVDVYLPPEARLAVAPGRRVAGGASVLAHLTGV